ncbi:MAG: DUF5602 domain-containing protein [Bacteroidales bacterium]|nr:DUF5602 domain-containing protein [Bacteroidales bacterium]
MKTLSTKTGFMIFLSLIIGITSCKKDDPTENIENSALKSNSEKTFYGPAVPLGNGIAQAWVSEDRQGNPLAIGIKLSEKALENLPDEMSMHVLQFPHQASTNFYTHATVDWNPGGHEPPGTYDLPHFDFHFYTISEEERMMIGPPGAPEFTIAPASQYIPLNHIMIPGGIPQMGSHWIDLTSPEFNGQDFSRTFIWGSWDGSFIFWEPMITLDYFMSMPDETIPIPQPQAYQNDGWYASDYQITYSTRPNEYNIALVNLNYFDGE